MQKDDIKISQTHKIVSVSIRVTPEVAEKLADEILDLLIDLTDRDSRYPALAALAAKLDEAGYEGGAF